jgi:hypothetical protein
VPAVAVAVNSFTLDFKIIFITPAMASEPYWALAPSRSISILSIAAAGIALRSVPVLPRPRLPYKLTNEL